MTNIEKAREYAQNQGLKSAVVVTGKRNGKTVFFSNWPGANRWQTCLLPNWNGGVFASVDAAHDALKASDKIYGDIDKDVKYQTIKPLF